MRAIATFIALSFLLLPRAFAETGAVVVSGKVDERDQTLAKHAAEQSVRAAGWVLDTKPLSARDINAITACLQDVAAWPCVSKVVGGRGIRRVAVVGLGRDATANGVPQVVITARLVLADAELAVLGQRFCERCTDDSLGALTAELTKELLQLAVLESGRTALAVKSTPQGALYSVDGVLSGATDAVINIVPGTHVVIVEHAGFESATRTIEAVEGKTSEVTVTLLRHLEQPDAQLPGDQRPSPHPETGSSTQPDAVMTHRSAVVPTTMLLVGALAVAGGATALVFNQRDVTKPPDERQPRGYYDTVPAGITSIAGGVAIASLGGYLWWKYSRNNTRSAPMVTPVLGGAVLGVNREF
jgi:hypothetical protein